MVRDRLRGWRQCRAGRKTEHLVRRRGHRGPVDVVGSVVKVRRDADLAGAFSYIDAGGVQARECLLDRIRAVGDKEDEGRARVELLLDRLARRISGRQRQRALVGGVQPRPVKRDRTLHACLQPSWLPTRRRRGTDLLVARMTA